MTYAYTANIGIGVDSVSTGRSMRVTEHPFMPRFITQDAKTGEMPVEEMRCLMRKPADNVNTTRHEPGKYIPQ